MKKWKQLVAFLMAASMLLSLAACGGSSSDSSSGSDSQSTEPASSSEGESGQEAASGDSDEPETLDVGTLDTTDTFDPCAASSCRLGLMLVFDTVLKLNYDTQEVEPCIATDWQWLDDTTLQLTIRDDVTFSNGEKLTPDDVLYSLSRFVYENDTFDPGYDNIDFDASTIEGNVLTLKLKEIDADFLYMLANDQWASVVCQSYVEANPDSWWDAPCGSGPYVCTENAEGSHSSYTRRDDYWGDLPDAEFVTIHHYSESTTMIADFENGVLDMALAVDEADYLAADAGDYGSDVVTQLFPTYDIISVQLPEYNEIFDDIRVRQAIAMSIDYETFANAVFGSLGEVSDSFMISTMKYYASQGIIEYNPEKAKELLAEAGYGDGLDMKLVIPSTPANEKAAVILQSFLKEIGINLDVESYDFATAIPILMANGTDISIGGTGGGTYLASQLMDTISMYNTNGAASIHDEEFNGYLDAALATLDEDERAENYANAQQWLFENYRTLPIGSSEAAVIYHDNISNVTGLVGRTIDLEQVVMN
jgi:peptide/nickel transport system substrate-binding protein